MPLWSRPERRSISSFSGEGESALTAALQDQFVQIHLKPHAVSNANKMTCIAKCPSVLLRQRLGGDIEIPDIDAMAKIKIPAETQSGKHSAFSKGASKEYAATAVATTALPCRRGNSDRI
ncbi:DnaJ C-terminal domain-containing protein [Propionivibrio sp.]|uniref:DnaJ C-terminal domain-containing protein n=1 Tax=Propionivibrio sp. TaxID=2212460 RepID=UPI003414F095